MPPKADQAAIIILDVGRNVSTSDEKGQNSFFIDARECAIRVIERKILCQGNSLLGIILLGSKKTKNNMAEQCDGAFRHVELLYDLQNPTWQMIRNLPVEPTKHKGDWMDSLIVAADCLKTNENGMKPSIQKKIILMTNFKSQTCLDENDIEQVLNGFKDDNFELDIIGIDVFDESLKGEDIEVARKFIKETKGATVSFAHAMSYLLFNKKKAVKPIPWNVDLSIGPNIKIPISSYTRLKDETVLNKWTKVIKDPISQTASTTEGIIRKTMHFNTENQAAVCSEDIIKGYYYGQKVIPFSDNDKSLLYKPGDKSLIVYGFVSSSCITWQNLNGDSLFYVFGRKGDKKAKCAIQCLVECLHEMKLYAIVRRVYNNGNAPKMYVLMPVIDNDNYICLSMAELCYKDEIKYMAFPPTNLKKHACNNEQVTAFENLIEAMDLTKAYDETYDDTEAFPIAETYSPSIQYVLDCIAFRAMNPGKPLPQPRDDIMMVFKVPPMIAKRSREPVEKLKTLFTLTKIEKKKEDKKYTPNPIPGDLVKQDEDLKPENLPPGDEMPIVQLPVTKNTSTNKIGTLDPVNDFKLLSEGGKLLSELSPQMIEVIENLVYCNLDGTYSKALSAMKFFREECVKADPSYYNEWLLRFKKVLNERKKEDMLSLIQNKGLNLILKEENPLSLFDSIQSNESQLYENDTVPDATELTMDTEMNDLFDEM